MTVNFDDLFSQADNLRNNAKVDAALAAYKDIVALATEKDDSQHQARALHMAGVSAKEAVRSPEDAYFKEAINLFSQAETLYKESDDTVGLGALYRDMAIIHDYAGLTNQALPYFQKSIELLTKTNALAHLAITYDKLGLHYYKQGNYKLALEQTDTALDLFRRDPTSGFFYATTLYDRARIFFRLGQFDQAAETATESLSWFEADHDAATHERRLAQLHGLLMVLNERLGQDDQGKIHAKEYTQRLRTFDPLAAKVLEEDLEELLHS